MSHGSPVHCFRSLMTLITRQPRNFVSSPAKKIGSNHAKSACTQDLRKTVSGSKNTIIITCSEGLKE